MKRDGFYRIILHPSSFCLPDSAFASGFVGEANVVDADATVYGFDHVIDCERGSRDGDERLHFDARFADIFCDACDLNFGMCGIGGGGIFKMNLDVGEQKGMTHGNELVGALCRHDARDTRDGKDIALGNSALRNQGARLIQHNDAGLSDGDAFRVRFRADVHHLRASLRVEMG